MPERKIIHIDMDAFFAAIEQRDNPSLRGKPIAVGGKSERGVISTASYEARKYGVHSAMSTKKALQLCPQLIIVEGDHRKYQEVSHQIREIFHEYTDIIEPLSCDEAFLDVTHNKPGIGMAVDIAREIKQKIKERLNLTASAGISYNKFLAKIASDFRKPDGLCTIHPNKALDFIASLPIESFWGVGKVTAGKMRSLGIYNGYTLRQWSLDGLRKTFGKMGEVYYYFAHGIDERPVEPTYVRKSVGCEFTFEKDISTKAAVVIELYHVADELIRRLKKEKFRGHTLTLKVKFHDFSQITRSTTRTDVFISMKTILPEAKRLIKEVDYTEKPIRLLGLSVSNTHCNLSLSNDKKGKAEWEQLCLKFN